MSSNSSVEICCGSEACRHFWKIIQDIAHALKRPHGFNFQSPREIFDELRIASKGGIADYSGITYEKIEKQYGVFWPCPSDEHPGTPRLFEPRSWNAIAKGNGPFYFPDGKARFNAAKYSPPAEDADAEYPLLLTTGRVISHFLSGTQTRRIGPLVDQCPDPFIEVHSPGPCSKTWTQGGRLGYSGLPAWYDHPPGSCGENDSAGYDFYSLSLGREGKR